MASQRRNNIINDLIKQWKPEDGQSVGTWLKCHQDENNKKYIPLSQITQLKKRREQNLPFHVFAAVLRLLGVIHSSHTFHIRPHGHSNTVPCWGRHHEQGRDKVHFQCM